jgi:uncharacterized membrane protein YtjA (UPF0391 family)
MRHRPYQLPSAISITALPGRAVRRQRPKMLSYAMLFFIIALIAGALGFFGVAGAAVGIAKMLFFVFLVLFIISLVFGRRRML